jgi:TRAP-type C4-dicarboxylate transport system permease small subunit
MLNAFRRVNAVGAWIAAALLWLLAFVILMDVVLRAVGTPILWGSEVSVYILIAVVFLGTGYTYDCDGHFSITLLVEKLPRVPRLMIELAVTVLGLAFAILFSWGGVELVRFAKSLSMASPTLLHVPLVVPYSAIIVGGVSLSMSLVARIAELVHALHTGADVALRTEHSI